MDEKAMAVAIRQVARGLTEIAAVLDGNVPGDDRTSRRIALMQRFDVPASEGLDREEASQAFKQNGYNPRSFGGWVRRGLIERNGDRRYLTAKGRDVLTKLSAREPASYAGPGG
ncbi:MAG: hypothetical protein ACRDPY_19065 [Streptosporangiaceae bacterium]